MFVAYQSSASNIDPSDLNGVNDIFRFDFTAFASSRVTAGNGGSTNPSITEDGTVIAYQSNATNVINNPPGETDTNGVSDVFVTTVATHHHNRASDLSGFPGAASERGECRCVDQRQRVVTSATRPMQRTWCPGTRRIGHLRPRPHRNLTSRVGTEEFSPRTRRSRSKVITGDSRYVAFRTDAAVAPDGHDFNRRLDVRPRHRGAVLTSINAATAPGWTAGLRSRCTYFSATRRQMPNNIVVTARRSSTRTTSR